MFLKTLVFILLISNALSVIYYYYKTFAIQAEFLEKKEKLIELTEQLVKNEPILETVKANESYFWVGVVGVSIVIIGFLIFFSLGDPKGGGIGMMTEALPKSVNEQNGIQTLELTLLAKTKTLLALNSALSNLMSKGFSKKNVSILYENRIVDHLNSDHITQILNITQEINSLNEKMVLLNENILNLI